MSHAGKRYDFENEFQFQFQLGLYVSLENAVNKLKMLYSTGPFKRNKSSGLRENPPKPSFTYSGASKKYCPCRLLLPGPRSKWRGFVPFGKRFVSPRRPLFSRTFIGTCWRSLCLRAGKSPMSFVRGPRME